MIHLNGNLLCAIDTETTGLRPYHHDVIEVCFLPLDNYCRPSTKHMAFNMKLKPRRPDNIDMQAMSVNKMSLFDIMKTGVDPDAAADLFDEWFTKLGLPEGKRISPLAQNWGHDKHFLSDWLGHENFEYRIDGRYRDTMSTALYLNDKADVNVEQVPFPKVNLRYLCNCLKIDLDAARYHTTLYDCIKTAEVYYAMLRHDYAA